MRGWRGRSQRAGRTLFAWPGLARFGLRPCGCSVGVGPPDGAAIGLLLSLLGVLYPAGVPDAVEAMRVEQ
jgi:hypothetical protein